MDDVLVCAEMLANLSREGFRLLLAAGVGLLVSAVLSLSALDRFASWGCEDLSLEMDDLGCLLGGLGAGVVLPPGDTEFVRRGDNAPC